MIARLGRSILTLWKYQLFGLAMFTLGCVYEAVLLTVPRVLAVVSRLM